MQLFTDAQVVDSPEDGDMSCIVLASEGESATVQWWLPGGEEVRGARLFGQFVRRGEYQLLYSRDEGAVDPLPVVIE